MSDPISAVILATEPKPDRGTTGRPRHARQAPGAHREPLGGRAAAAHPPTDVRGARPCSCSRSCLDGRRSRGCGPRQDPHNCDVSLTRQLPSSGPHLRLRRAGLRLLLRRRSTARGRRWRSRSCRHHRHRGGRRPARPAGRLLRRLGRRDHLPGHRHLPRPAVPARRDRVPRRAQEAERLDHHGDPDHPRLDHRGPGPAGQRASSSKNLDYVQAAKALGASNCAAHVPAHPAERGRAGRRARDHRARRASSRPRRR